MKEIRILIAEDSNADAEMIVRELGKGEFPHISKRVSSRGEFLRALDEYVPDIILCDYKMPSMEAPEALKIVKERCPQTPFIVVSGTIGEDTAVEMMKSGAVDYVMKGRLVRLVPAVQRALKESQAYAERKLVSAYEKTGREVFRILLESGELEDSIQRVLAVLKARTRCEAVGMRLQDGDDFPYFVQEGFSKDFLMTENTLTARGVDGGVCLDGHGNISLECTCGLVISGKTDSANPLFTQGGSFWTNNSFPLLELPPDQDPRLHPRNECIHQGYASVALVAIRTRHGIVGLLQFNDRKKECFSLPLIEQLESIATHIGEALIRKKLESEAEKRLGELEVFYKASLGREARILELKNEVAMLKRELNDKK